MTHATTSSTKGATEVSRVPESGWPLPLCYGSSGKIVDGCDSDTGLHHGGTGVTGTGSRGRLIAEPARQLASARKVSAPGQFVKTIPITLIDILENSAGGSHSRYRRGWV